MESGRTALRNWAQSWLSRSKAAALARSLAFSCSSSATRLAGKDSVSMGGERKRVAITNGMGVQVTIILNGT